MTSDLLTETEQQGTSLDRIHGAPQEWNYSSQGGSEEGVRVEHITHSTTVHVDAHLSLFKFA